ncbi:MAG TPA: hypothetical protein VGX48_07885 [Pyrinomonadaceae bacterium]|jgi:hypothetical protein|nr:hypothetical protein [Pyrinomonadaceae bacterium]
MAEERNVGLARAPETTSDPGDPERTKAELQRRMEEARESITQTVTEIKDTVVNQYQQVRETITDSLDWREQYRRRPVHFSVGAFVGGALVGYVVMGALKGGRADYEDEETDAAFSRIEEGFDQMPARKAGGRSYAASPVLGGAAYQRTSRPESNAATEAAEVFGEGQAAYESAGDVGPGTRPSYSSGYQAQTAPQPQAASQSLASAPEPEEEKGPGLIARFKETKAYDKLQDELGTLGERFIEELSQTARTVVVPALLGKLKDLIGVDLSGSGGQPGSQGQQQARSAYSAPQPQQSRTAAAGTGQTPGGTEGYGAS